MVLGLFPSFFQPFSFSGSSKHTHEDDVDPQQQSHHDTPQAMMGFGSALDATSAEFAWSPLLGMRGIHTTPSLASFARQDVITPGSTSSIGSSSDGVLPNLTPTIDLPAWCTAADHKEDDFGLDDISREPTMSLEATHHPTKTLRRMGRVNVATGKHKTPSYHDQAASPELQGSVEARSVMVNPYAYPTPANRPLRQYVSAPVLSESEDQAAPSSSSDGTLAKSTSADDLFSALAWSTAPHTTFVPPSELADTASAPAQLPEGALQGLGLGASGQGEIDGSLYRRRAQQSQGQMPSPKPIHTSAPQSMTTRQHHDQQQPQHQRAQHGSQGLGIMQSRPSSASLSASHNDHQEQSLRLKQLHELHMQQAAFQRSAQHGFYDNLVTPAQQHAGQHTCEIAARNVQAALLYGQDSPERRNSLEGMKAFDSMGNPKDVSFLPASPYVNLASASTSATPQPQSHNGRYFVYSGALAPPAAMQGMSHSGAWAQEQQQQHHERLRKQSMPTSMYASHYDPSQHGPGGNIFEMEGLPDMNPNHGAMVGTSHDHVHSRPLSQAETMPLMSVGLPSASASQPMAFPAHPWSHSAQPHQVQYQQTFSALGAPDSANSLSSSSMPLSAESFMSATSPLPRTPVSGKRQAEQGSDFKRSAKKTRSSPNLRSPRSNQTGGTLAGAFGTVELDSPIWAGSTPAAGNKSPSASPTNSARKIASNRRVQSSKDLRAKAATGSGKGSPSSAPLTGSASNSPARGASAAAGTSSGAGAPSAAAGFAFVNYGVEDAKELCSAVAPSGSYKIPLKGYGSSPPSGGEGGEMAHHTTTPRKPTAAGAAAIAAHKRTTPRMPIDTSRWIFETGEDSGDDDDDDEDGGDEASSSATPRRQRKRTKSGASAKSTPNRAKKATGAAAAILGEPVQLSGESKK